MKKSVKNLMRIVIFFFLFSIFLFIVEIIFFNKRQVNYAWYRVQNIDENIDVLVLGNSHAFTSTNAAVLSEAMRLDVEVFASSNQNMQGALIHLESALRYKNPKYVLLEVYSPVLDSRDNLNTNKRGVHMQDLDGIQNYVDKGRAVVKTLEWNYYPEAMFQLFRPINTWDRWKVMLNKQIIVSETHGYEARKSAKTFATGSININKIQEECEASYRTGKKDELATYNKKALEDFLNLTEEKNIKVVLYKAPMLRVGSSGLINSVFEIAEQHDNVVLCMDTCLNMTDMGLTVEDFYDDGHLNVRGGEKFTYFFGNVLSEKLKGGG